MENEKTGYSFEDRVRAFLPEVDRIRNHLLDAFREVLVEIGEEGLAESINEQSNESDAFHSKTSPVHSICFQIQNLVEEAVSTNVRDQINSIPGGAGEAGYWKNYFYTLKEAGISVEDIKTRVERSSIEVVYTKHPTEAKRWIILHLHRRLFNLIISYSQGKVVDDEIKETLELMWRSGELYTSKPTVKQEKRNLEYYFSEVFPAARMELEKNLKTEWSEVFPESTAPKHPQLKVASWVGGDRDGHPLVTGDVTRETLLENRTQSINCLLENWQILRQDIRFNKVIQSTPKALRSWLSKNQLDPGIDEPWTAFFSVVQEKLEASKVHPPVEGYIDADAFKTDLDVLKTAFEEISSSRLIKNYLLPIYNQLDFYGLHGPKLDIRQNSDSFRAAIAELLNFAGVHDGLNYSDWPEEKKLQFIEDELSNLRPLHLRGLKLSEKTAEVLNTFRCLRRHAEVYGFEGIGPVIVSMTKSASDLMLVYLFCKEVGLIEATEDGLTCKLPVTPLFETMADMQASVGILDKFLNAGITKRTLKKIGERTGRDSMQPQIIMLGYSDSNKDCGIFASQWSVYNAQKEILSLTDSIGIPVRFFHGRGGTVGRGNGPMHRFIEALPQKGLEHGFRITEQGEVIAQKYSSVEKATASFEQLLAGVSCAALLPTHEKIIDKATPSMMTVRDASMEKYRSLITTDRFIEFYRSATPIDVIERSNIGSRPARRTGMATLGDLRAIPWVFSWNQARFYLPGWFGLGTGLKTLQRQNPEGFGFLKSIWREWPFLKYLLYNAESTVASASPELMKQYAALGKDQELTESFMKIIFDELRLAEAMLNEVLDRPFSTGRPRLLFTLQAREKRLHKLHLKQIELIREWRALHDVNVYPEKLISLLQVINAIASGLKTTG